MIALDESQAVLPGVTVTVVKPDTGFTQNSVTDGSGTVRFIALQPGTYSVKVDLAGFTTVNQEGVTLRVGQTAKLTVTLKVAKMAETVNVTAEAPLVDVYKTDSSTNIVPEQIESLPVANRDFQQLAFLAPGVQRERGGNRFVTNQPVIGAAGNAQQSTIMVDGVDFTDPTLGLARARFSQEAISEFRVIANRFDSEIGGSAGGALSIVTKAGTNDLHGSAFGFFRDKALRAQGELDLRSRLLAPAVRRHARRPHRQGPHPLLPVRRAGQREQLRAVPARAAPSRPAAGHQGALRPDAALRRPRPRANDDQNLRFKAVYERYRQDNFRVGGVADESDGMKLDRDNYNFSGTHAWTISNVR